MFVPLDMITHTFAFNIPAAYDYFQLLHKSVICVNPLL